eukprot:5789268-Amphidinium_carterae.1
MDHPLQLFQRGGAGNAGKIATPLHANTTTSIAEEVVTKTTFTLQCWQDQCPWQRLLVSRAPKVTKCNARQLTKCLSKRRSYAIEQFLVPEGMHDSTNNANLTVKF